MICDLDSYLYLKHVSHLFMVDYSNKVAIMDMVHSLKGQWDGIVGDFDAKTTQCHGFLSMRTTTPFMTSKNDTPFWHFQPSKWLFSLSTTQSSQSCKLEYLSRQGDAKQILSFESPIKLSPLFLSKYGPCPSKYYMYTVYVHVQANTICVLYVHAWFYTYKCVQHRIVIYEYEWVYTYYACHERMNGKESLLWTSSVLGLDVFRMQLRGGMIFWLRRSTKRGASHRHGRPDQIPS